MLKARVIHQEITVREIDYILCRAGGQASIFICELIKSTGYSPSVRRR